MNVYEYREGLPSEEEVRAHAEVNPVESSKGRRGRWMGMGECGDLRIFDMSPIPSGDPPWHIDATEDGAICDMERVANDVKRWRPCAPDGTPCAWPNQDRRNEGGHVDPLKPFTPDGTPCPAPRMQEKYCVADDEENYLPGHEFDTREEAAAFGFAEFDYADTIFTARIGDPIRPVISVGDVESWIEGVCHDLPDGEDDEWMGDKDIGSLAQTLTSALHAWLDAHNAWPQSCPLLDEQKHERPLGTGGGQ